VSACNTRNLFWLHFKKIHFKGYLSDRKERASSTRIPLAVCSFHIDVTATCTQEYRSDLDNHLAHFSLDLQTFILLIRSFRMDQTQRTPSVWNTAPRMPVIDQSTIAGKKPNKIIPVPHEYRRQAFARECDTLIHDLKTETGCIVVAHWNQGNINITSFDIYGSGPGIEKAVRHLHQWISNAHAKSMASSAWAKTTAYNYDKWYYEEVEHMENVKKQRFKGPIPPDNDPDAPKHAVCVANTPNLLVLIY
jgi:hypothetical protein